LAPPLIGAALILPLVLPLVQVTRLHSLPASSQQSSGLGDTVGFPELARTVAAQDASLTREGKPPSAIFAGYYAEAAALNVFEPGSRLPPVLSGQNAYWTWGPGHAGDQTVLVVDALGTLKPYFASCRLLTTFHAPYHVRNDWTGIPIGVCTGPRESWGAIWPSLKYFG